MEVGQYAIIADNESAHGFEIGEVVQLFEIYYDPHETAFWCINLDQEKWPVVETDLKPIKK